MNTQSTSIFFPGQSDDITNIGGKADGLLKLMRTSICKVPPFFVLRAGADFSESEINAALAQLSVDPQAQFAVRSSCLNEDQSGQSFAGQYQSFLNVEACDVSARIIDVIYSVRAVNVGEYKKLMVTGDSKPCAEMAVLVQLMVPATVAGVAFSINPVTGAGEVFINAVDGLADDLVGGIVDGEQIIIRNGGISRSGARCALSDPQALSLSALCKRLAATVGYAADVEWAIRDSQLYFLQMRPVTTSVLRSGEIRIFDGSNIQESYPGITTPMTFSFVRRAYLEVYRSFVRLMGVSEATITANEDIFSGMLGYIDGHIYYNLGNWYRLLALLPAYKTNRDFMEKMMGLKEPATEVRAEIIEKVGLGEKLSTAAALIHVIGEYFKLERSKAAFEKRLDTVLTVDREQIRGSDLDSLCKLYRRLEMVLLRKWDAPIVNDFFAMIFFGLYQKLAGDDGASLLEDIGDVISARPPQLIAEIAAQISDDSALIEAMREDNNVESLMSAHTEAYALYKDYLDQFGDRAIGELKLEITSVRDNPAVLNATIATLAQTINGRSKPHLKLMPGEKRSKNFLITLINKRTRDLIAGRENLRFARTRVFGLVRDIINTMAQRLVEQNLLDSKSDIYYLEIEEVLGFIEGTTTCKNLGGLVALRRAEEKKYHPVISDRVRTDGPVGINAITGEANQSATSDKNIIQGLAACSGTVRGIARVIKDPAQEHLEAGEILVAERTDPGWIMHFALARGIVTSYGSMLSHTAIVARELKIPAVVSAKGAFENIRSGDLIEIDGGSGTVTILEKPSQEREEQWALRA